MIIILNQHKLVNCVLFCDWHSICPCSIDATKYRSQHK